MSNTVLLETNNINVIWEITPMEVVCRKDEKNPKTTYAISLIFTVYVNWKMKSFQESFAFEKWEIHDYQLKDFWSWYMLHKTLWNLWYKIKEEWRDEDEPVYSWNIILKWIYKLVNNLNFKLDI